MIKFKVVFPRPYPNKGVIQDEIKQSRPFRAWVAGLLKAHFKEMRSVHVILQPSLMTLILLDDFDQVLQCPEFKKSEGCMVVSKIKNKGKVATQFSRSPFLFGWQPLLEVAVFSSKVVHSPVAESAHRTISSPKQDGNVWQRWKY